MSSGRHSCSRREFLGKTLKYGAIAGAACFVPQGFSGCSGHDGGKFDMIVKGGEVYDGSLNPPTVCDIGIKDGKIVAIGVLEDKHAKIIDAGALIVAPGFIDVHTHCDLTFKRTGWKKHLAGFMPSWKGNHNYLYQGVTTVVSGNCGYGYTDTDGWLETVEDLPFGSNVAHLVPHGMIREELFGEKQPGSLSAKQLEALKSRVAEEMDKGALGLSVGLAYAPGSSAETKELIELCKVVRSKGGLYAVHMRDENGVPNAGAVGLIKALEETVEIAEKAEIPVQISHLKISEPFGDTTPEMALEIIERARDRGLDVTADQYPYAAGSTILSFLLPDRFKSALGVKEEFRTKAGRKEIVKAIEEVFGFLGPEKTMITMYNAHQEYEGKNISEIAEIMGKPPAEAYAEMVTDDECPVAVFFAQRMDVVKAYMPHDYVMTASDGWTVPKDMTKPHPRTYGTFPRKIKTFVLDEKIMPLGAAIRSMTSLPAEKFKLKGRGKIEVGAVADITVFDLKTIADRATYKEPHQYCRGIVHVISEGEMIFRDGEPTGERNGKALRRL